MSMTSLVATDVYGFERGKKFFELSNHLGNVLVTVTDRKNGVRLSTDTTLVEYYLPDIASANDYYPFGMTMPGRSVHSDKYRYGFNGKENDNETGLQDYGFRIYNPGLGKFLSVDPLTDSYPWNSPYSYAEGDPVNYIDIDGAENGSATAAATVRPTVPQLGVLYVGRDGTLRNSTQLFTSGTVNSGNYASPMHRFVTQSELERLRPPNGSLTLGSDGVSAWASNGTGRPWRVSLLVKVHKAKPWTEMNWVERALVRLQVENDKQFNKPYQKFNTESGFYEQVTTDPSQLSNEYLNEVNKRLLTGEATAQDRLYAEEVSKRIKGKAIKNPETVTFIQGKKEKARKITALIPAGYRKTKLKSQGEDVFTNGKFWITPDNEGHNGGIWKKFDKEKNVGSTEKSKRLGTFGRDLNHRVGD